MSPGRFCEKDGRNDNNNMMAGRIFIARDDGTNLCIMKLPAIKPGHYPEAIKKGA